MRESRRHAAVARLTSRRGLALAAAAVIALVALLPRLLSSPSAPAPARPAPVASPRPEAAPAAPSLARLGGDPAPAPAQGQLGSFSVFAAKDPFAPQLGTAPATTTPAPTPVPAPAAPTSAPATAQAGATAPTRLGAGAVVAVGGSATRIAISVDGVAENVRVGESFPAGHPVFTLVGVTSVGAEIGVAGGSYASGSATVTLTPETPLTLVNTRDGTRYDLALLRAS